MYSNRHKLWKMKNSLKPKWETLSSHYVLKLSNLQLINTWCIVFYIRAEWITQMLFLINTGMLEACRSLIRSAP